MRSPALAHHRPPLQSVVDMSRVLSVDLPTAEAITGFSRSTLRRAIAAGDLLACRYGSALRIRLRDLDSFLMKAAGSDLPAVVPVAIDVAADQPATARSGA